MSEMTNGEEAQPAEFIRAVGRALNIMEAFTDGKSRMTLTEIAERTSLTKPAARRFLITLCHLGYVNQQDRYFHLTPRTLDLGYAFMSSFRLPLVAQPYLDGLARDLGESCAMGVLDGGDVLYIGRASASQNTGVGVAVGVRTPAYSTSMGRVLLAALEDGALEQYLEATTFEARTRRTVTDRERLRTEILRVRHQSMAIVDQETTEGWRSVATAVHGPAGDVLAAVNVSAPASRVNVEDLEHSFLPRLREATASIEHAYAPGSTRVPS